MSVFLQKQRVVLKVIFFSYFWLMSTGFVSAAYCADKNEQSFKEIETLESFNSYKELLEFKLDSAEKTQQKDIQLLLMRLENQDKRISDIGLYLTAFGVVLALLALVGGWFGVITVKSRAREEAHDVAQQWFSEKQHTLDNQAQELSQKIDGLQKQLTRQTDDFEQLRNTLQDKLTEEADKHQETMQSSVNAAQALIAKIQKETLQRLTTSESDLLAQAAELTRHKPESKYTFSDWNTKAFNAEQKGEQEEAITYWRKALEIKSVTIIQRAESLFKIGNTLESLERYPEAILIYGECIDYGRKNINPKITPILLKSLLNKGKILTKYLKNHEEAILTYDALIDLNDNSLSPAEQVECLDAVLNKGFILEETIKDVRKAIETYDTSLHTQFITNNESVILKYMEIYYRKSALLERTSHPQDSIVNYNDLIEKYKKLGNPKIQEKCAEALIKRGRVFSRDLHNYESAITTYDTVLNLYAKSKEKNIQGWCARALYYKASTLGNNYSDFKSELEIYDSLLEIYGDSSNPEVHLWCARSLFFKGLLLKDSFSDLHQAISIYDNLLFRYGKSSDPKIQLECAEALAIKAWILSNEFGKPKDAINTYDNLLLFYDDSDSIELRTACAGALTNKGWVLSDKLNKAQDAIAIFDSLLSQYGSQDDLEIQSQCAKALFYKGQAKEKLNDMEGASTAYIKLLERFNGIKHPGIYIQYLNALKAVIIPLLILGQVDDAISKMWEILDNFDSKQPESAITVFLLWLAENKTTKEDILAAIKNTPDNIDFNWSITKIQSYTKSLPSERQETIKCFLDFFQRKLDLSELSLCLYCINQSENKPQS